MAYISTTLWTIKYVFYATTITTNSIGQLKMTFPKLVKKIIDLPVMKLNRRRVIGNEFKKQLRLLEWA